MRQYDGFKAERSVSGAREVLPAGGYVAKILAAKEEVFNWGSRLTLRIDILEGEFKDFFKRDYDSNSRDDRKWRGKMTINVPSENDTGEYADWHKREFNDFIYNVEASNPGFHWDWDENKLKGLKVGALFNNFEWNIEGRTGWSTECKRSCPVDDIHNNSFKIPKDRPLKNKKSAPANTSGFSEISEDDGEVPF